ncbi:MAG: transcriptional regulator, partial [Treponemataceae bacterium]|nr:transcriptional regulator [Treponemataceae bacterium]
ITDYWCLDFSTPGQYDTVLSHILTHKYFINQNRNGEISMEEAITSWFETVYMPVIRAIEKYHILRYIRNRTESDLYVWIIQFYDDLKKWFGDDLPLDSVVSDIRQEYKWTFPKRLLNALKKKILKKEIGTFTQ